MTYQGIVQNGVIVLNGGTVLPEGATVSVAVFPSFSDTESGIDTEQAPKSETIGQEMARLAREYARRDTNLPTDLAANHDHYLHGMPKRQ